MANEKEAKNKKETKNKKSFFKDFKAELKKVIWPTPKQLVNNTIAVVVIVIITATIVFILDGAFKALNEYGINKLKSYIRGYNTIQIENEEINNVENIEENSVAEAENIDTAEETNVEEEKTVSE